MRKLRCCILQDTFGLAPEKEIRSCADLVRRGDTSWLSVDTPCSTKQKKQQ